MLFQTPKDKGQVFAPMSTYVTNVARAQTMPHRICIVKSSETKAAEADAMGLPGVPGSVFTQLSSQELDIAV